MRTKLSALVVCGRDDRLATPRLVLEALDVKTRRAGSCKQAETLLGETPSPHLVLTDIVLSDGNWLDVADLTARCREKVNVIVVSPVADVHLYAEVVNYGAFDFVTESFTVAELAHVVRSAIDNTLNARQKAGKPQVSSPRTPWTRLMTQT